MTWDDFKKNLNRAGTFLMQRTGLVDRTVDADYELWKERLKSAGIDLEALHRESKAHLDAIRAVTLTQDRLAHTLNMAMAGSEGELFAQQVSQLFNALAETERKNYDEAYRATVLEPIARFALLFPECETLMKKRQERLLDYDAAKDKVKRKIDKPAKDVDKLPRLEAEAERQREAYEEINNILVEGMPTLIAARLSVLEPSLFAYLQLQRIWGQQSDAKFSTLKDSLPHEDYEEDGAIREQVNELLADLKNSMGVL